MKNIFLIMCFIMLSIYNKANAQDKASGTLALGMRGEPLQETPDKEVQGNPYLEDTWSNGSVILDGNQKAIAKFKFDIYSNSLLFLGKNGETLELKSKFNSFNLNNADNGVSNITPLIFVKGYPAIAKQTESTFYQLIADGKTGLLKYYKKIIDEQPGTNYTSSTTRRFKLLQVYYILKNNQLTEIQPNKKAIVRLFDDHAQQLDAYLKTNSLSFKSDSDLQKLFIWYNSLN
jgi:hypothetical protein